METRSLGIKKEATLEYLHFAPIYYAPVPKINRDGSHVWQDVEPYNSIYLKKTRGGKAKPLEQVVTLDPGHLWIEPRWVFVRRTFGDELIAKIFYRVISWIWQCNDIIGEEKRTRQDKMIYAMFGGNGVEFSKEYTCTM